MRKQVSHLAARDGPYFLIAGGVMAFFFAIGLVSYLSFNLPWASDQALFAQIHYNIIFNQVTETTVGVQVDHFSFHFSPIMIVFAPLYALAESWIVLFAISLSAIGATAILIGKTAQREFQSLRIGTLFTALFLVAPSTVYLSSMGYRLSILAMAFITGALYAYLNEQFRVFAVLLVLTAMCKENVVLVLVPLSGLALLHRRSTKWVATPALFGMLYFFAVTSVVMPALGSGGFAGVKVDKFGHLGASAGEILVTLLANPIDTIGYLTDTSDLLFYLKVLGPAGFLAVLAPEILLIPSSQILITTLPQDGVFSSIGWWYQAPILPFVWIGSIFGLKRLDRWGRTLWDSHHERLPEAARSALDHTGDWSALRFVIPALLLSGLLAGIAVDGYELGRAEQQLDAVTDDDLELGEAVSSIPDDASVSAQFRFLPQLSNRDLLYEFPEINDAEYVLATVDDFGAYNSGGEDHDRTLEQLNSSDVYVVNETLSANGSLVYERRGDRDAGEGSLSVHG